MTSNETQILKIKELDPDIIPPSTSRHKDPDYGGAKLVVIGKPGTGKTTLISSLLYSKKHIIPIGIVMSGSEDSNGHYKKMLPNTFVFNDYDEDVIKKFY